MTHVSLDKIKTRLIQLILLNACFTLPMVMMIMLGTRKGCQHELADWTHNPAIIFFLASFGMIFAFGFIYLKAELFLPYIIRDKE